MSKHSTKLILLPLIALFSVFILFKYTAVTVFAIGKWTLTGEMNVVHQNKPVATLQNGKYLIAGGLTGSGVTNVVELYDPATGQWAQTGNLTALLSGFRVVALLSPPER